jgi:hypothetical protein
MPFVAAQTQGLTEGRQLIGENLMQGSLRVKGAGASVTAMDRSRILIYLAVLTAGLAYLSVWHAADHMPGITPSGEGLMAPLDDAYIFGQYARQTLHGQFLHYTPGAPISTGVSSFSWLVALTALMGLGWPLTWAAWALGLACLAWSSHSLFKLGTRLFPALPNWLLPALFLAHASSVSQYFQGMDTGLLLAALLATAEAAIDPKAGAKFWAFGSLLVFTRPEGQIAFPLLALARAWPQGTSRRIRIASLSLALAVLPTLGLFWISGSTVPDSIRPKTAGIARLVMAQHEKVSGTYAAQVLGFLMNGLVPPDQSIGFVGDAAAGNDPSKHFPPLALIIAAIGIGLALRRSDQRPWWLGMGAAWLATLACLSWTLPVGWHRHRYLTPLWPLIVLGAAACLDQLRSAKGVPARLGKSAVLTLWFGFGALTWPWFLGATQISAARYAVANREAAFSLRTAKEKGPIAVEDAGLLAYYSGRQIVDLLGVTDHLLAQVQLSGRPAVLEELLHLPLERRPSYAVLHTQRKDSNRDIWTKFGFFGKPRAVAGMQLYPILWGKAEPELRATWDLDLGWRASEDRWWTPLAAKGPLVMSRPGGLDAGRILEGMDGFKMPAHPEGILVVRAKLPVNGCLSFWADPFSKPKDPSSRACASKMVGEGYTKVSLRIPSGAEGSYGLSFDPERGGPGEWACFHYWFIPTSKNNTKP